MAMAPDMVPSFIWKEYSMELVYPVLSLINLSLLSKKCPRIWKSTNLHLIPKIRNPVSPLQLRPISISSPIIKICERHILGHILPLILPNFDPFQFGGLPRRSTTQYLAIYLDKIIRILEDKSKYAFTLVTDFNKAYDNLDHNVFISNLRLLTNDTSLISWLESFLSDRVQYVRAPLDIPIRSFTCANGVPQGSVLGGIIFGILVNNLATDSEFRLKFVDDLSLVWSLDSSSNDIPTDYAEDFSKQVENIKLSLNPAKCNTIVHNFHRNKSYPVVKINNSTIVNVDKVKILGVWFQDNLSWDVQVDSMLMRANKRLFIIYKLKRLNANINCLKIAYTTYIRPLLEYCAPVWSHSLTLKQSKNIESLQKRVVKIIFGNQYKDYSDSLSLLSLSSLGERRKTLSIKFAQEFFKEFPTFLTVTQLIVSGRTTRNSHKHIVPFSRTKRFDKSPIINSIKLINS